MSKTYRLIGLMAVLSGLSPAMVGSLALAGLVQTIAESPVDVPAAEAAKHRIGTRGPIYCTGHTYTNWAPDGVPPVEVELVVATDGGVLSARTPGRGGFFEEKVVTAAKAWRYRPFQLEGRPVQARFRESIAVLPLERRLDTHVPFPEIRDWDSLRIILIRTNCYGSCPDYKLEIHGDGTVLYEGESGVAVTGLQRAKVSRETLLKLLDYFRQADYFSLADGYVSLTTDCPTYATSISFDGHGKWVLDYIGKDLGMPNSVSAVEAAIDRLSGALNWIRKQP